MRLCKKILLLVFAITVCSGCIPHTELDNQAIVEAIGIDYADNKYEVTVQYFNMEGTGGNSPIDSTKANVINITGKGESVTAALESASLKCGRPFMYGITGLVIIGRDALDEDIVKTMSFAESYYQSNPSVLLAAADGKASDILGVKFKEGIISIEHLRMILDNADYNGIAESIKILEMLSEQRREYGGTVLPVLKSINNGSDASDDGKTVELSGGYLIADGRFTGEVSLSDMSGLMLLEKRTKNALLTADFGDEKVEITAYDISLSVGHHYNKGKLIFDVSVRANGKYTDSQLMDKDASFSSEVEKACAKRLIERIESAFLNSAKKYGCDPCGLKYVISSENHTEWIRLEENFGEVLKNSEFNVSCDMDIDRFGIAH